MTRWLSVRKCHPGLVLNYGVEPVEGDRIFAYAGRMDAPSPSWGLNTKQNILQSVLQSTCLPVEDLLLQCVMAHGSQTTPHHRQVLVVVPCSSTFEPQTLNLVRHSFGIVRPRPFALPAHSTPATATTSATATAGDHLSATKRQRRRQQRRRDCRPGRQSLEKAGVVVKFVAGTLRCEGGVTVSLGKGGKLELEGPLSDKYFRVREVVYKQYVIV